jgi:hypothetical protein
MGDQAQLEFALPELTRDLTDKNVFRDIDRMGKDFQLLARGRSVVPAITEERSHDYRTSRQQPFEALKALYRVFF